MEDIETDAVKIRVRNRRISGETRVAAKKMKYSRLRNSNLLHYCAHGTKTFRCSYTKSRNTNSRKLFGSGKTCSRRYHFIFDTDSTSRY